jgi:hypothetical protein
MNIVYVLVHISIQHILYNSKNSFNITAISCSTTGCLVEQFPYILRYRVFITKEVNAISMKNRAGCCLLQTRMFRSERTWDVFNSMKDET